MDYSSIKLMNMMATKMAYLSEKQDVLAQNIANIDTPGYKAKQLHDLDFNRLAMAESRRLKMRASTGGASMEGIRSTQNFRTEVQRKTYETTPVENSSTLEEQMAMVAHNKLEYATVTNLYSKTSSMFKTALGDNH
ncbi:MAG: flagellar basal body rod protein FlgB [Alphaproteobacteria bacterium]|nr:MAG: flagellar basal body rod protein FlgB [Alphaproteobacteria bacterium]TAF15107.1 MAG: flagellar basal body rod protein FlgB [Alphaproteobacteria bacterium]TAF39039.1 MAG: flagellar basal body rod protein FlgB [Alphaproteobacteria bacterium]TAF76679.1 MAG: flagellar basal body rod protein FlgB [Alphaproteobacteria bacterium]